MVEVLFAAVVGAAVVFTTADKVRLKLFPAAPEVATVVAVAAVVGTADAVKGLGRSSLRDGIDLDGVCSSTDSDSGSTKYLALFLFILSHVSWIPLLIQFLQGLPWSHCRCFPWQNVHALDIGFLLIFSVVESFFVMIYEMLDLVVDWQ